MVTWEVRRRGSQPELQVNAMQDRWARDKSTDQLGVGLRAKGVPGPLELATIMDEVN